MPCPWCKHFDLDQGPAAVASVEGEGMALFGVSGLVGAGLPTISVTIRSVFEIVGREEEVGSLYAFIVDAGGRRLRSCSRAKRASGSRPSGSLASSMRAREAYAFSPRGRPRPSAASLTSGWAICSQTSSTPSCLRLQRRSGARSRSRCSERTRQLNPLVTAPSRRRCTTCCRFERTGAGSDRCRPCAAIGARAGAQPGVRPAAARSDARARGLGTATR